MVLPSPDGRALSQRHAADAGSGQCPYGPFADEDIPTMILTCNVVEPSTGKDTIATPAALPIVLKLT